MHLPYPQSFWLGTLAGAAVLLPLTAEPSRSESDSLSAGCSELIEFSDCAEIGLGPGSGHHLAVSSPQQERICYGSHFFFLDESFTEATSTGAESPFHLRGSPTHPACHTQQAFFHSCKHALQAPEMQQQPTTSHSSPAPYASITPPVTPGQTCQRFGPRWQTCETPGPITPHQLAKDASNTWDSQSEQDLKQYFQVVPEAQQELKQDCMLGTATRQKVQVARPLQRGSASTTEVSGSCSAASAAAPASAAASGSGVQGKVLTAEPLPSPKQTSSKKRLLDLKILELQLTKGKPAALSEKMIREELGNNPDTSKALRRLTQEGKLMRTGKGGRSSPFSYSATQEAQLALQQLKDAEKPSAE